MDTGSPEEAIKRSGFVGGGAGAGVTSSSSSPSHRRSADRWPTGGFGGGSGPASLGCGNNDGGSPALEYDLWEGQFQFVGGSELATRHGMNGDLVLGSSLNDDEEVDDEGRVGPTDYEHSPLDRLAPVHQQVQMIQEQMHVLADTQSAGEERYARVKQENATLQARILMLEEAAKDAEARAEERLESEQRRHREYASRLEREKELQLENLTIKLQAAELESSRTRDEVSRLREQLDKLRAEKTQLENALDEAHLDAERAREAEKRVGLILAETNRALKRTEEELAQRMDVERRMEEMAEELTSLRVRNKNLEESRDELQAAAAALQAGRELFMSSGQDPNDNTINRKNSPSLATELLLTGSTHDQADGVDNGKSGTADICDNFTTLAEAKQALKEQREVNTRLRTYMEAVLLNIVENQPELLEVKQPH